MFKNLFNRFFPTPAFLSMLSFGLDISDESIKFISFTFTKDGIRLKKYGERKIPPGIIESGKIKDPKRLEEILLSLRKEEGIKSVRVSLPEEQIYLFKMYLDKTELTNIRESIELSLEEHIPVPAPDTIFDYEILSEDVNTLQVQVAAIPKSVIQNYLSVFKNSSIFVPSFELEAQATSRAVIKRGDLDTYMIVDFGAKRTGIFIISQGIVVFTSTLDVGGEMLNSLLQTNLKVSSQEAEEIKKTHGLQKNVENKEIFDVLLKSVSVLRGEIEKHLLYWHTHKDKEGKNNLPIKKIILCGGDSNLIGLSDYLSIGLKRKVENANVWINILDTKKETPQINFKQSLSFATTIGLALGNFEHD